VVTDKFNTCSYDELTDCIRARIEWIREYTQFLHDENSLVYSHLRGVAIARSALYKSEIRRLLKMRRVLKRSRLKNWNSDILSTVESNEFDLSELCRASNLFGIPDWAQSIIDQSAEMIQKQNKLIERIGTANLNWCGDEARKFMADNPLKK
jgi:hypothetical protein